MGFYGNITNTSKTTFQFDKIYPNRLAMDAGLAKDGIMLGRYVLVEYDTDISLDMYNRGYYYNGNFYTSINHESATRIKYDATLDGKQFNEASETKYNNAYVGKGWVIYDYTIQNNPNSEIKYYICTGSSGGYALFIELENSEYVLNYQVDLKNYNEGRGYDSSVWVKTSVEIDDKLVTKYVQIAELNTVVPTFDIAADAPSMGPMTPHFDTDSTNVYYKLHLQPAWGMRVAAANGNPSDVNTQWTREVYLPENEGKSKIEYWNQQSKKWEDTPQPEFAAAIYFNKAGFDKGIPCKTEDNDNYIEIRPTGMSGNKYTNHNSRDDVDSLKEAVDTQEVYVNLPSIGNMMSEAWDIIHGPKRDDSMLETDEDGKRIDSLQGRLNSFYEMENDTVAIKRADDGKMIGAKVNGGRTSEIDYTGINDDHWIETKVDGNNQTFTIKHKFDQEQSNYKEINDKTSDNDTTSTINLNDGTNTFQINTPIVDSQGHTVGKNVETITLPYGFKTIKTNGRGNGTVDNTGAAVTADVVADNTQDILNINSGNNWIKIDTTAGTSAAITISHDIHTPTSTTGSETLASTTGTNTFSVPTYAFDGAGHYSSHNTMTYTLPKTYGKITADSGSSEADATVDTFAINSGDDWLDTKITNNEDKIVITHTGPVGGSDRGLANLTPKFGQSFEIEDWSFDDKGHKNYLSKHTITIPSPTINNKVTETTSSVLTSVDIDSTEGRLTFTNKKAGDLELGVYAQGTSVDAVGNGDKIYEAFAKLQNQINKEKSRIDTFFADANMQEAAIDTLVELQTYIADDKTQATQILADIGEEEKRAKEAEAELLVAIQEEAQRAAGIEGEINTRIDNLNTPDTAQTNYYVSQVTQSAGKINVQRAQLPTLQSGSANGTIKLSNGNDVSVKGLGSAAYENTTAFAPSGYHDSDIATLQETVRLQGEAIATLQEQVAALIEQLNPTQCE